MKGILIGSLILVAAAITFVVTPPSKNSNMSLRQKALKKLYPAIMKMGSSTIIANTGEQQVKSAVSLYSLSVKLLDESTLDFSSLKNKKVMIVNTASDCGFTAQYGELEKLYQMHKNKLVIIGFPANDFGNQEKHSNEKIAVFCIANYGVSFPMAEKDIVIKGKKQQPVYHWLSHKSMNGWSDQAPTWNFCKYIIDENGTLTHFMNSSVSPLGKECLEALGF